MLKLNLYCYRVNNKLLKNVYRNSIFKNYVNSLSGSLMLVLIKQGEIDINFSSTYKEFKKYNIAIFGVCLNYKIYSIKQLENLNALNYDKNISLLNRTLKNLLK